MKKLTKQQGGFTLIEVVLVLAIGALIILMALLAFNGAQRARRDTARQNAAGTLASSVEQFSANSDGALPTGFAATASGTVMATTTAMNDPLSGTAPQYRTSSLNNPTAADHRIFFVATSQCNTTTKQAVPAAGNTYSIVYRQESGTVVCKDNSQ